MVHGAGREGGLVDAPDALKIDLPGHGLSSNWPENAPETYAPWQQVIDAVAAHFTIGAVAHEPHKIVDPVRHLPDLTPDRYGHYLTTAWSIVRAQHIFSPWYAAKTTNALPIDPQHLDPVRLAVEHRALIRATAARAYATALNSQGDDHGN